MEDEYLEHLNHEIEALRVQIADAEIARKAYVEFVNRKRKRSDQGSNFDQSRNQVSDDENSQKDDVSRKGLRASGESREFIEFLSCYPSGKSTIDIASALATTATRVGGLYARYHPDGIVIKKDQNLVLTKKGYDLLARSQPYVGNKRFPPNETPPGSSPDGGTSSNTRSVAEMFE